MSTAIGVAGPISTDLLGAYLNLPVAGWPAGMGGTSVTHLVCGLLERGLRVSVYTLDPTVDEPTIMEGDRLTVFVGPFRRAGRMRDFMRSERRWIRRFIRADQPGLVHAHWTYEYALGALACSPPVLITVRDWAPEILRQWKDAYRLGRMLMNGVTMMRGQHFAANSPYIRQRIQPLVRTAVPVIPNAVPDAIFNATRYHEDEAPPVIVSVNNGFGLRKNVTVLLRALPLIQARLPRCRLRLIGAGYEPYGPAVRWAQAERLTRGVTFVGALPYDQTIDEIRAASLMIHPAVEESFGMTILEAMAVGTPVVAGKKSGAVPWVTGNGTAAVLTDITTPFSVATEAVRMLADADQWRHYSSAGFARASAHFRTSAVTELYLDLYQQLLLEDDLRPAPASPSLS